MMTQAHATPALTPHLICSDAAAAIDFYKQAFGAEELMRIPGPDGALMHAAVSINGASVFLVDENAGCAAMSPTSLGGSSVTFNLGVADVDASMARAEAAGASVKMPAEDQFWGDRYGLMEDPFGHRWAFVAPIRQMSEAEIREAASAFA
jgi:PhnB protein